MTRDEFLDEITTFSDLYDFCIHNGYDDMVGDLSTRDDIEDEIDDDIYSFLGDYMWYELRDRLDNIDLDGDWFRKDGRLDYVCVDDDFDDWRDELLDSLDYNEWFDEEAEEDDEYDADDAVYDDSGYNASPAITRAQGLGRTPSYGVSMSLSVRVVVDPSSYNTAVNKPTITFGELFDQKLGKEQYESSEIV